jgi:tetratricopeptide (TPR) repeat protein
MDPLQPLDEPRAAVDRGDWQLALDLLADRPVEAASAEGLELLASAAYGNGEFEASISAWEDLHELLLSQGDRPEAARAAAMVAMFLMMDTGLMAPVRGWLARAERLLDADDEVPADALIATVRTYERFMCGDMVASRIHSTRAIELGTRLGVQPAVVIASVAAARLTIFEGRFEEGLELLEEVGALLMSGQVDPLTTGIMYCELICAAQGLALHDRAVEWTEVMDRWRSDTSIGAINGRCRVHRAELLRISGPCDEAEEEALAACEELRPWMRREFGWPLAELGTILLRKGDLEGAEQALLEAHEHSWCPQPALSLLRLAQGDADSAASLIADAIAHPLAIPSKERPPFGDLRIAPFLAAQAEIAVARDDSGTVRAAADALQAIADTYPSRSLEASASVAAAQAALVEGDLDAAIERVSSAISSWADIGAPFETATARLVLAEAHRAAGNVGGARMELQTAQAAFASFGADRSAEQAEQLIAALGDRSAAGREPDRTVATFRSDGGARTINYGDAHTTVRDLQGFRYVERLLAEPGREFHVLDLVAGEKGTTRGADAVDDGVDHVGDGGSGLPLLDDQAREAYRRRILDVEEDIEEATRLNDLGRLELAQHDRDYLVAELTGAIGLGGRNRSVGGTSERARTSVTRSIRYALGRLAEHDAGLAAHLEQRVRTGTYCVYTDDPLSPVVWETV